MARSNVRYATIFVFPSAVRGQARVVSSSPERLVARPGDAIEWTVVNASGMPAAVTIGWEKRSPLKGEAAAAFERRARDVVRGKAKAGVYKYSVLIDGQVAFDPELEIMG